MPTLVITDIPRLSALFEKLATKRTNLVVVGEIHRGIEELDRIKPNLIIIQNHLSGLSADIVHKHLKSRLGRRKVRFALISGSDTLDVELSSRFETILDPSIPDEQLEQSVQTLFAAAERSQRKPAAPVTSILELPPIRDDEPELPGLKPDPTPAQATQAQAQETVQLSPTPQPAADLLPSEPATAQPEPDTDVPAPITYDLPRRPNMSIISAFSQHLDTTSEELPTPRRQPDQREQELAIRDLHLEPHLISDYDEGPPPFYRRASCWLIGGTVALVVAITLFQHRSTPGKRPAADYPAPQKQITTTIQPQSATTLPIAPTAPTATPPSPAPPAQAAPPANGALQSHGVGRPKALPSFIPQAGLDRSYGKDNPGWENYRGQANEYRVFREKDATIKAIQIIDRSGAGIQDAYYIGILKELAGVTAMRPTSSEIKEGYEIRRGETNGLQLVQYRDAQGGRLRGIVITWP